MSKEFVDDVKVFYKTVGKLDGLASNDLVDLQELNTLDHASYLKNLCKKYDINVELSGDLTEDILDMEKLIDNKFSELLDLIWKRKSNI